ncbi:MAG: peptidase MA family metallohydrolase [bacterium]
MAQRRRRGWLHKTLGGALALGLLGGWSVPAQGQEPAPQVPPPPPVVAPPQAQAQPDSPGTIAGMLSPAARAVIDAPFNTPQEARALRIKHGVPMGKDLALTPSRAQIALLRGLYADASLRDERANPLDRAEALVQLGQPAQAIGLIGKDDSPRALAVTISALEMLGQRERAAQVAELLARQLIDGKLATSGEIVSAVQGSAALIRLTGPKGQGGADFTFLMQQLAQARVLDPLDYRVPLAEAQLLMDKDNFAQAREAVSEAAGLNPTSAQAYLLAGRMAVLSFDFDTAQEIASRLDMIAGLESADEIVVASPPARSAHGAVVRAAALLRQDDPAQARALLLPHVQAWPDAPLLLEITAGVIAAEYDFPALDAHIADYERRFPGQPRAALQAGQTLADLRQYAQAERLLEHAWALAPLWAAPATDLGLLGMQSGLDELALRALTKAVELDPFNVRAGNTLKLLNVLSTYQRTEGAHFVIRSRPGLDARLAAEMLPILEGIHADITGDAPGALRYQPPFKTVIDLAPDHASFAVRIAGVPRIHTIAASTGPVIAMESPRDGRGHSGAYDWARVLRHEYVHTVGLSRTGNRLPHWFTEAQAVFLEQAPRDYNTVQLLAQTLNTDDLFDLNEINIAFTRPKRPQDRALAYAQGHWMYQFMVERFGAEAPLRLMDHFAKGAREEEAFTTVLGTGREGFMQAFKPWAHGQLQQWGMASAEIDAAEVALRQKLELQDGRVDAELATELEAYAASRTVDPMPHKLLAGFYLQVDPPKAVEHLRWLDVRQDKEATYAAQIAAILAQQGDSAGAWASAQRAVRLAPYNPANRELAAAIAVGRKDWPAARAHIEFLAELEPNQAQHQRRLDALTRLEKQSTSP